MANVWLKALRIIKRRVSKQIYETWFQPCRFITFADDMMVIEVPSSVFRDVFIEKYQSLIEEILEDLTDHRVAVSFVITNDGAEQFGDADYDPPEPEAPPVKSNGKGCLNQLNPKYTFTNFVVGGCNQFAHAAAAAVAERPAKAYNPLFIYGGVGLGKTHLMHAIGHQIRSEQQSVNMVYVSSEAFTNEVIASIRDDKMPDFRRKYREVDVLLIDDIQFIAGKESTQGEFFHTFNSLYESHKQIVLTSDMFPKEIPNLEERLRSRFEWGLIADIQAPSLETKVAILQKKAMVENIELTSEVAMFIAQKIQSNIRELEGCLIRLGAYASMAHADISVDFARHVLKDLLPHEKRVIDIELIQKAVAKYFDIKISLLRSKSREQKIARPRQVAMYLCREYTDRSLPEIGERFGGKDHSTVIYACKKIEEEMAKDPVLRKTVSYLASAFRD